MLNRLAADRGKAIPDGPYGPRAFPDPEELASLDTDDLKRHGFSSTKARTIIEIAQAVVADVSTWRPCNASRMARRLSA